MLDERHPTPVRGIWRVVFALSAAVCLAIGAVGVVLPGIPTTPFLLLMSYFLIRSSPTLHACVLRVPFVGRILDDWHQQRAVRRPVKVLAIVMVLAVVTFVVLSDTLLVSLKITIATLAAAGIVVISRLPSRR